MLKYFCAGLFAALALDAHAASIQLLPAQQDRLVEPQYFFPASPFLYIAAVGDTTDTDHDGLTDEDEWQLGTDPKNPDTDGDGLTDGEEVHKYHTNPLKADTDGDGLSDGDEVHKYHTDPKNRDTDGDGLSDGDEVNKYHTDPLLADTDGDGLSDFEEVITYHTDPLVADTDGDGLSDGDEVHRYHTDPLKADTDGDGLSDGDEVFKYHTDPLKVDTDGDGLTDYEEIMETRTDPLNPDTDNDGFNDKDDACPRVAGIRETRGCPLQVGDTLAFAGIDFEGETAKVQISSSATLSRIQTILKLFPNLLVQVVVYADSNSKHAGQLTSARANNLVNWLIAKDIPERQLEAHGGGGASPDRPGAHTELVVLKRRD